MTLSVVGRHVEISSAFQDHVRQALDALWEKHHITPVESHVSLSKQGPFFICDMTVKVGKSSALRCQGQGATGYASFDNSLNTLTRRLRRHREKLKDFYHHAGYDKASSFSLYVLNGIHDDEKEEVKQEEYGAAVIAEMKTDIPALSVKEAVMEMDLKDREVFIFQNKQNEKLNVLYRRRDGHIGWIDPKA